jgi:peptide/nickel transport system substrate-binding protein
MKKIIRPLLTSTALLVFALSFSFQAKAANIINYATIGEPPSLDVQVGTATIASTIGNHMFETLYSFDSNYVPQPLLASGERIEDGGKTIIISLREGVPFHNGQELTANDVVASLKRWGEFGSRGKQLMANATSLEATGKYEVTLRLSEPNGAWKSMLSYPNGGSVIYPADIANAAGGKPIDAANYIGTGPFKFHEWLPNRYVELVKFDNYKGVTGKSDGYAGERVALVDALRFIPVPDVGTRVSGVQAGDYDYAEFITGDLYETLAADKSVVIHRSGAPLFGLVFMNSKAGPLKDNFKLRRAIQMALNKTEALQVSIGPESLWKANGSFYPKGTFWYCETGIEAYNQHDPVKARALAKEAGYDGTPLKLLVSTNYKTHYDQALVFNKQLTDAGFKIEMVVVDWATLLQKRAQPDQWDMFVTHHDTVPDPILFTLMNDSYPGWWQTPEKEAAKARFTGTADPELRLKAWSDLQGLIYEQVPAMKVGDVYAYNIASPKLKGLSKSTVIWAHFWGVSK